VLVEHFDQVMVEALIIESEEHLQEILNARKKQDILLFDNLNKASKDEKTEEPLKEGLDIYTRLTCRSIDLNEC